MLTNSLFQDLGMGDLFTSTTGSMVVAQQQQQQQQTGGGTQQQQQQQQVVVMVDAPVVPPPPPPPSPPVVVPPGTGRTITITEGSGQTVVNDFVGVGRGIVISDAWKAMIDTLKFVGANLTAAKFMVSQQGADTLITFEGVPTSNTSVLLKNFDYQLFDNIPHSATNPEGPFGNAIFNGQTTVTDNIDIMNREGNLGTIWAANSTTFLNNGHNVTNGLDASNDVINAMDGNDIVHGLGGDDLIRGQNGNDTLYGDAGNDTLDGGAGDDKIYGGNGNDTITGGSGRDLLYGDAGNDIIYGGADADKIEGGAGDDKLYGEDGNDTLTGGAGTNYMYGGNGFDTFFGGSGKDIIDGGNSTDMVNYQYSNAGVTINYGGAMTWTGVGGYAAGDVLSNVDQYTGSNFDDVITAAGNYGGSNNKLYGMAGNDVLSAGSGIDIVDGGSGNDTIEGGKGDDVLTGGLGNDVFVFKATDWGVNSYPQMSHDAITDFQVGMDTLKLSGLGVVDVASWMASHIIADSNGDVIIVDNNYNVPGAYSSSISLVGVKVASLTAASFDFS